MVAILRSNHPGERWQGKSATPPVRRLLCLGASDAGRGQGERQHRAGRVGGLPSKVSKPTGRLVAHLRRDRDRAARVRASRRRDRSPASTSTARTCIATRWLRTRTALGFALARSGPRTRAFRRIAARTADLPFFRRLWHRRARPARSGSTARWRDATLGASTSQRSSRVARPWVELPADFTVAGRAPVNFARPARAIYSAAGATSTSRRSISRMRRALAGEKLAGSVTVDATADATGGCPRGSLR